jgi:hypothetical protein
MDLEKNILHDILCLSRIAESLYCKTVEAGGVEIIKSLETAFLAGQNFPDQLSILTTTLGDGWIDRIDKTTAGSWRGLATSVRRICSARGLDI